MKTARMVRDTMPDIGNWRSKVKRYGVCRGRLFPDRVENIGNLPSPAASRP